MELVLLMETLEGTFGHLLQDIGKMNMDLLLAPVLAMTVHLLDEFPHLSQTITSVNQHIMLTG